MKRKFPNIEITIYQHHDQSTKPINNSNNNNNQFQLSLHQATLHHQYQELAKYNNKQTVTKAKLSKPALMLQRSTMRVQMTNQSQAKKLKTIDYFEIRKINNENKKPLETSCMLPS